MAEYEPNLNYDREDKRTIPRKAPPVCAKCEKQHWHFAKCEDASEWVPPTLLRVSYRPNPRQYQPSTQNPLDASRATLGYGVNTSVLSNRKPKGG